MDTARIDALKQEILALPDQERQQLAQEVLPVLLMTRAGLAEIDQALDALSDDELDALVERARRRAGDLPDEAIATLIAEALRAAHPQGRP
jgi:hypothetical protein